MKSGMLDVAEQIRLQFTAILHCMTNESFISSLNIFDSNSSPNPNIKMFSSILSKLSLSPPTTEASFLSSLKFTACLGQGGFGIVFKAVAANPSPSSQTTAVKFIFPAESNEKEQQQILRECELASTFRHENIAQILNVEGKQLNVSDIEKIFKKLSKDDEKSLSLRDTCIRKAKRYKTIESICIQMELCGENLRRWLHQGHDKDDPQINIMQIKITHGIVSGLKYLHDKKIVHRDLKPENVMFSHEGFQLPVKIGDFGLCRTIHSADTQTNLLTSRAGTGEYMAPEAFTNDYSYQADLFSLGLVIWEVFQLIKFHERKILFDKLVNDWEEDLLIGIASNEVRKVIFNLTRRKKIDRTQSVAEIVGIFALCTSEHLGTWLRNVANGERVVLDEGLYEGEFVLEQDNVEIVGAGGGRTVLKGLKDKTCLTVIGSGCTISDIKVISEEGYKSIGIELRGSRNTITNVEVAGGSPCFQVRAEGNRLKNLTISDAENGIRMEGCRHIIEDVKMVNIRNCGVWISANQNAISNLIGTNVGDRIVVRGSNNNFSSISLVKHNRPTSTMSGMYLLSIASNNTVSNLTCSGYSHRKRPDRRRDPMYYAEYVGYSKNKNYGWDLRIASSDTTLTDSKCENVWVQGKNTVLTNVDCGKLLKIARDATLVKLTNCMGQALEVTATMEEVTSINSNFDKIYNINN